MQFIVKFFPEITIKSKPVRRQFVARLRGNIRRVLKQIDPAVEVKREWDKIVVQSKSEDAATRDQMVDALSHVTGIAYFLDVQAFPLGDMDDILERTLSIHAGRLAGKTFALRCKRAGQHDFKSIDVERYVGGGLNQHSAASGVSLSNPDVVVNLEIRDQTLYVVSERHKGLGGFPLGSLDPVLSLMSGGFDSTVSSFLTMKRGLATHFCFFNLGGRDHELGVMEVSLYLWMKYGCQQRVRFISVPFEEVVAELLGKVENSQMGVVLKRMMLRAGSAVAKSMDIDALVTGESVAQVSSQTLRNISIIDSATDLLVLRPLATSNKGEIIDIAREIGTEEFAAAMPEYCGVISVNPTTRARPDRIAAEEAKFDFSVLERAIENARSTAIDELADQDFCASGIEVLSVPLAESTILDIRHPDEEDEIPLLSKSARVTRIPFYELHSRLWELDTSQSYMLYCGKGVMSRLQAGHLAEQGFPDVKVYKPEH